MATTRNLNPGFFRSADLVDMPFEARLLFAGLWCLADREGRLEDRPKQIKLEIFPADEVDVASLLDLLVGPGLVQRYTADGRNFLWVVNFAAHQTPHPSEPASALPSPAGELIAAEAVPVVRAMPSRTPRKRAPAVDSSFNPVAYLVENGADEQSASDYLAVRMARKAPATMTALRKIVSEGVDAGMSLQSVLELCCERSWVGFKAEWVTKNNAVPTGHRRPLTAAEDRARVYDVLTGRIRDERDFFDAPPALRIV